MEPIIVTPNAMPDPDGCLPGTRQEMAKFISDAISVMFAGTSFGLINVGSDTPAPENQDRPWFRTTSSGYPLGLYYFYNGKWVRSAPFPVGTKALYTGDSSVFDGTGKGNEGTVAEGWFLCNGQNGTEDLRDRFIVGAKQYKDGAWRTDVDPSQSDRIQGGAQEVTLNMNNLPPIEVNIPIGSDVGGRGRFVYGSNTVNSDPYELTIVGSGQNRPRPFEILPPFYAQAIIVWNPLK